MLKINEKTKKQIIVFLRNLGVGAFGSILGTLLYDFVKNVPPLTTLFGFLNYNVRINLFILIVVIVCGFLFLFLLIKKMKKSNFYKLKYEKYKEDFFPKNTNAPFIRINVDRDVDLYKYGALVNDLYKYLPAYKISREDNVIVVWITPELKYKQIDELLKKIQDENTYIKFDWLVVGV